MRVDFHSHTTCSDGELSPTALVKRAASVGVTHLAVTDHDGVAGIAEASLAGQSVGVTVVPGIEISAQLHGREVHVLGHFLKVDAPTLLTWSNGRRTERRDRLRAMVEKLAKNGVHLDFDAIEAAAKGATLGRPHIARALIEKGYVTTISEAFSKYLNPGRAGAVEVQRPDVTEAIVLVRSTGGTTSLAHPGLNKVSRAELKQLADKGLDAVEADHPDHPPAQAGDIARWAKDCGLLVTGGSDFHGPRTGSVELGARVISPAAYETLAARSGTPR